MTEIDATAAPETDSREEVEEKDSVIQTDQPEGTEPDEGTPEAPDEEGEETPEEKNDDSPEDPDGAPDDEEEEEDPLKKAKKHADRKISKMGEEIAQRDQTLIGLVNKSPELLIEMYDQNSSLYNKDLADKIRAEHPETYQKADAIYKQRRGVQTQPPAPAVQGNQQQPLTQEQINRLVEQKVQEARAQDTEVSALNSFRDSMGYSEEEFKVIEPSLKAISQSIRSADPEVTAEAAYRRAFVAMFPADYEQAVKKDALVNASKKLAAQSPGGGGGGAAPSKVKLSEQELEAARVAGISNERYAELKEKGLI